MRFFPSVPLLVAGLWLGADAAPAQNAAQGALLARALDAAAAGDWQQAETLAREAGNPIADDLVLWTRLRDGAGEWREYEAFLARRPDWPSLEAVRRAGERQMPSGRPPEQVLAWFANQPPQTGTGSLRLAEALAESGREAEAVAEAVRAWREFSMTGAERKAMLARWEEVLAPHHEARMDMLLWRGFTAEAEGMMPLVSPDWQKLAQARIATRRDAEGLQYLINTVPAALENHPGLAYERYLYRVDKGRWQEAEDYLREKSRSAEALGRPELWMERRANLARQALEDGQVEEAYAIAARSFGSGGPEYADAEWVAGFIALTRMRDPAKAAEHFRRFQSVVVTPISLGRAGYWLGLAHAAAGDEAAAQAAFAAGARHQTSFYGQLAAERLAVPADPLLAGEGEAPDWREAPIFRSSLVQAAFFLHVAGDEKRSSQFFRQAAANQPPEARAAVAQMAIDIGRPEIGIRIAKDAAGQGLILPDQYYPLHPIGRKGWRVPKEFAMAVARQESEFNPEAGSSVGARGLMQLMPATAKHMADVIGLQYDPARLDEPLYNARLGTEYLARMLDRYDGSYLLATAAYNAGPGRVDQWLGTLGDPREPGADVVAWIESIPFTETRNYVMRVLEGLHVYRARLRGSPPPIQLVADLGGRGDPRLRVVGEMHDPATLSSRDLEGQLPR
jgi:soluble lytic murein transglycosylase